MSKVALITGATRGIGRALSLGLAKNGYNIAVVGKSTQHNDNLPGTIYSVSKEIESLGVEALPIKADLRHENEIEDIIKQVKEKYDKIDVLINNAGALYWNPVEKTTLKNYDLVNSINSRASFYLSKLSIPLLNKSDNPHIITKSPPLLYKNELLDTLNNKTAYMISKWGMTLGALGLSKELDHYNIAVNTLWPMTAIESYAVKNNNLGNEKLWRKPDIIVDSVKEILNEDSKTFTGNQLVDELYLRSKGYNDFKKYQCIDGYEPPKLSELTI